MINPFAEVNWNPDRRARRKFAASLMIGFPVMAAVFLLVGFLKGHALNHFLLDLGAAGLAAGIVFWLLPQIARPFYVVWHIIGCCLGIVMGNLLLTLFYYLIFTPLGICLRLRRNPPVTKGFDRSKSTYWREAGPPVGRERYFRQF